MQIMEGDGLPNQICLQCLQITNRAYTFKQQCEKSDNILRQYLNSLSLPVMTLDDQQIVQERDDQFFSNDDILQTSSIFNDIFSDVHASSFNFATQNAGKCLFH